jgi:hypothetical protein
LFPHGRESGKVFFIERRIPQVRHVSPQAKQYRDYKAMVQKRCVKSLLCRGFHRRDWTPVCEIT